MGADFGGGPSPAAVPGRTVLPPRVVGAVPGDSGIVPVPPTEGNPEDEAGCTKPHKNCRSSAVRVGMMFEAEINEYSAVLKNKKRRPRIRTHQGSSSPFEEQGKFEKKTVASIR